jgi:hypothetical protein
MPRLKKDFVSSHSQRHCEQRSGDLVGADYFIPEDQRWRRLETSNPVHREPFSSLEIQVQVSFAFDNLDLSLQASTTCLKFKAETGSKRPTGSINSFFASTNFKQQFNALTNARTHAAPAPIAAHHDLYTYTFPIFSQSRSKFVILRSR